MKKILVKDKKNRKTIKHFEINQFILKQISSNSNFQTITKWNALNKLSYSLRSNSKTYITNRCIKTVNKKTFNKFFSFSRMVFLKLARNGLISGLRKSSW